MKNLEITPRHSVQELVTLSLTLQARSGFDGTICKKGENWPQKSMNCTKKKTSKNNTGI
jgi:hypothetical protein